MRTTTLPFGAGMDVEVDVHGAYHAGAPATETDPGWSPEAEVHRVMLGGVDISDQLSSEEAEHCHQVLLEAGPAQTEARREDHNEHMRESARGNE